MIEVIRGRLDAVRADEVVDLWTRHGVLTADVARERLSTVVCVVIGDDGAVAGVSSAFEADVPHLGDRRLWMYRRFVPAPTRELDDELLVATFDVLDAESDPSGTTPIGLCVVVDPETGPALGPEAVLPTGFLHVGYELSGRQIRVRYFAGGHDPAARTATLPPGCTISLFADTDAVTEQEVLDFWSSETTLGDAEARKRLGQVFMVAVEAEAGLVGLLSTYPTMVKHLGVEMWVIRAFVAAAHRRSNILLGLFYASLDELEARHVAGTDRRGAGLFSVFEDGGLRSRYTAAVLPSGNTYVGDSPRGEPMFVRWFQGATVPVSDPRL